MNRTLKRIILIVAALAIVGTIALALRPKPVEVETAPVTRGLLQVTVDEDGKTRVRDRYIVSAPLTGRLLRIQLDAGDTVEPGVTLLAAIEPRDPDLLDPRAAAEAAARVQSAKANAQRAGPEVERAKAELQRATNDLKDKRDLLESGAATKQEVEDAELLERSRAEALRAAEFTQQIADFELKQAEAALLRTRSDDQRPRDTDPFEIHSPCAGRVLRVMQESTAVVNAGTPLIEVGDPTNLELVIDVLSTDAVKIKSGDPVIVERWGGENDLAGRVRLVEPSAYTKVSALGVEEQRVDVIVDLVDPHDHWKSLGDAYRIEARIVIWSQDDVLRVPAGALFREGDDWAVFVVEDGVAIRRPVELGHQTPHHAQVIKGLTDNDAVIIHPGDAVSDGVRVRSR